ncbi:MULTISPECIES: type IV toxin-antitoxin system AbiEi family antitoxin domain-containing protein [unclassified Thioalkalivibrio]|uniref:type IV toxin-antitoxin system AbiEi family antitoxin domain-containing protein n=1 Tax=unclassified Thioalkalivibrio TaxID=2621013 RepID=UPI001E39F9B2|nr:MULTISPECIES: type IV toxin-antitoxin system AbiEi family antitoxin domain-containing protein [unclassified Thioalkalivibrio]
MLGEIVWFIRSVATITRSNLKALYTRVPPGTPLTTADLNELGISADLAVYYVRSGWLERLARGVYCRPGEDLGLEPSLVMLQRKFPGMHVGGKSALEWYGIRHYVMRQPTLQLYGWASGRLPGWFFERFPAEYHRKRLFNETPEAMLHVGPFEHQAGAPDVAAPERALLELLSEVGVRQPLQEVREIVQGTYSLRANVLRELLCKTKSIKTVRLALQLGREFSLPWAAQLDPVELPTGSDRPWVSGTGDDLLVLKP